LINIKSGVYKISFKPEGYVQVGTSSDGDSGGVEELEEDDLLDDDDDPKDNIKKTEDEPKKVSDQGPAEGRQSDKPQGGDGSSSGGASGGGKSVKRALLFEDEGIPSHKDSLAVDCANLLGAMELEGDDVEDDNLEEDRDMVLQDDNEKTHLPKESELHYYRYQ
jgi:hypothetical protein